MDIELNRRITRIVRALYYSVTNEWAEISKEHNMSSAQQYLLYMLYSKEEDLTVSDISTLGCWHISTVTRLLKPLLDDGYISMTKRSKGRYKFVHLTELGELKLKEIAKDVSHRDNFPLNCAGIKHEDLELFAQVGLELLRNQKGSDLTQWMKYSETQSI